MLGKIIDKNFQVVGDKVLLDINVSKRKPGLLLIHADWCGHCKRFQPIFDELHTQLGDDFPLLSIEDSDLKQNQELIGALNFRGYPTIKFFDQTGKIMGDYTGDRTKAALVKHICQVFHHCIKFH